MSVEDLDEFLGPKVPESVANAIDSTWEPEEAMTTYWTERELNPPADSDYDRWLVNCRLVVHERVQSVLDVVKQEYDITRPQVTVRKLLRFGLPTVLGRWGEPIQEMVAYREAAATARRYIHGRSEYPLLVGKIGLNVDWGRKVDTRQWRVIWCQKAVLAGIAKTVGIDQSDALRWAIFTAGDELAKRGVMGPGLGADIRDVLDELEYRLENSAQERRRMGGAVVLRTLRGRHADRAAAELRDDHPTVLQEILEDDGYTELSVE